MTSRAKHTFTEHGSAVTYFEETCRRLVSDWSLDLRSSAVENLSAVGSDLAHLLAKSVISLASGVSGGSCSNPPPSPKRITTLNPNLN